MRLWPPGSTTGSSPRRRPRLIAMRKGLGPDDLDGLLERPLLAVLATYGADGTVLLSPVWHRWRGGGFDVVTGRDDVKVRHLRRDPRASIVVCEHEPPYRGIEVRSSAVLGHADEGVVRDIAVRYLGEDDGLAYVDRGYDRASSGSSPGTCEPGTSPTTSRWGATPPR